MSSSPIWMRSQDDLRAEATEYAVAAGTLVALFVALALGCAVVFGAEIGAMTALKVCGGFAAVVAVLVRLCSHIPTQAEQDAMRERFLPSPSARSSSLSFGVAPPRDTREDGSGLLPK